MVMRDWADVQNLLVMRLDNIGDVILTGPALRAIKERLPRVHLTLMASPAGVQAAPLLPWIDDAFSWRVLWQDLGRLSFDPSREWALVDELRSRRFDAAIIFTSFSQSPHAPALACDLAGIPLRLGDSKERSRGTLTTAARSLPDEVHQAERNLHLIRAVGFSGGDKNLWVNVGQYNRRSADQLLSRSSVERGAPFILFSPWASARARTCPTRVSARGVRELAELTGLRVVVTGAERERERAEEVLAILGRHGCDLIGKTSVSELSAMVERASLVVANNTAAIHFADAVRTPVIVLYSGTDYESQWRPRATRSRVLRRPTACSPCYAFDCPRNMECLQIDPHEIAAAGLELLAGQRVQPGLPLDDVIRVAGSPV